MVYINVYEFVCIYETIGYGPTLNLARCFVHPQWELVRAVAIATHRQGQALLALFPAFKLLCREGVVRLQCERRCLVTVARDKLI